MVKKEKILGEVSYDEMFSLQDSDLDLFETLWPIYYLYSWNLANNYFPWFIFNSQSENFRLKF